MRGFQYFSQGFTLITTKGLKRFVLIPLSVNLILFAVAFYFLYGQIQAGIVYTLGLIPDWLGWLKDLASFFLWPLAVITVLLLFAMVFGTIANLIAAPFNGLLAEKVEQHLTGQPLDDQSMWSLLKDVPRMLGRELRKLQYYIPRALGFLLLLIFIPVFGQIAWFIFGAWMMAIQYCDYPFDNHKVAFKDMRRGLSQRQGVCLPFGIMVSIISMVPILNFVIMPVAVCGATAMWVNEFRPNYVQSLNRDVSNAQ